MRWCVSETEWPQRRSPDADELTFLKSFCNNFKNVGNCPSGWVQLQKKCIQLFSISSNLPTARRFCEDAGAKIFVPNEKSEIRELSDTLALFGLREEENWPWVGKGSKIRSFQKFQVFLLVSNFFHSSWIMMIKMMIFWTSKDWNLKIYMTEGFLLILSS